MELQMLIKFIVDATVRTNIQRVHVVSFDTTNPAVVEKLNAMGIHAPYKPEYTLIISKK